VSIQTAKVSVIGGGLAGSEAAWQIANRGIEVVLYEMRPKVNTGAHLGDQLAELVCSNSLGSNLVDRAPGLLKEELRRLNSLVLACAQASAVPAGGSLAVDRELFARTVTQAIEGHAYIQLVREEVTEIPSGPVVVASGPLTSPRLAGSILALTGREHLYFYDAIAPIVDAESIDLTIAFRGSRYQRGERPDGDYINCPLSREQYQAFVEALVSAERINLRHFESNLADGVRAGADVYFESCLPVEVLASRGKNSLAFGPMRPAGIIDPTTGRWPFAVVQLRQDNLAGTLYNVVGFQTNLTFSEQRRVLRMIPGLENAEFERYGQMHRNTFIFSPTVLEPSLQFRGRPDLYFAGQITGVEGYVGNIATGLLAGLNLARYLQGEKPFVLPETTMLGALCHYITHASPADFQPMKANYGLLPPLDAGESVRGKRQRAAVYTKRALSDLERYLNELR